jgi:hypothetical protein
MKTAADRIREALDDLKRRHGALVAPQRARTKTGNWHEKVQLVAVMAADLVEIADVILKDHPNPDQTVSELRSGAANALRLDQHASGSEPVLIISVQAQHVLDLYDAKLAKPEERAPVPVAEAQPEERSSVPEPPGA